MFAETKCADSCEKKMQNVCRITENPYLCNRKRKNAEIAQLVEHNLAKVRVASSSLVFRSCFFEMLELNFAQVAELVDALVSGASGFAIVQVRVLFWAPIFQISE